MTGARRAISPSKRFCTSFEISAQMLCALCFADVGGLYHDSIIFDRHTSLYWRLNLSSDGIALHIDIEIDL